MRDTNTNAVVCAGVDIGKAKLDCAVAGRQEALCCANSEDGRAQLMAFLKRQGVQRVGLEASGDYEIEVVDALRAAGFEVIMFQPMQVRAYGAFKLRRAKNDRIDAILIAACTAAQDTLRAPPEPRMAAFAEHLTRIDQITEDAARAKVRLERYRDPRLRSQVQDDIKKLTALKREEMRLLLKGLRAHDDLKRKLRLLLSIRGIGEPTAMALLVRMPELGTLSREQAASLLSVAPFVHESGRYKGQRRTGGGRARARASLFAAAQAAALRWNPDLMALYKRLVKAGKPHSVAIIACVRKMVIYANAVLARNEPWTAVAI